MDPMLEELYQQHRRATEMLTTLRAAARRLAAEGPGAPALLGELAACRETLQTEIASHFEEEEAALFVVLGRRIGTDGGPIAVMLEEHRELREAQAEYVAGLAALQAGSGEAGPQTVTVAAERILQLLPPHIEKEEGVLFPMADELLDEEEWAEAHRLWRAAQAVAGAAPA